MKLAERQHDGVRIFQVSGRLDVYTVTEVKTQVLKALAQGDTRVVMDLGGVEFIDSSGIGALVVCLKRANEAGGGLKLAGAGDEVRSMFEITRTDRLFELHPGADEAAASFG